MREVAVVQSIELRCLTIQSAFDTPAHDEVGIGRAVIGTVGAVLLGATAELGVGHDEGAVPAIELNQRRLEHGQALGQLAQQVGMGHRLVLVGVEAAQGQADGGHRLLAG